MEQLTNIELLEKFLRLSPIISEDNTDIVGYEQVADKNDTYLIRTTPTTTVLSSDICGETRQLNFALIFKTGIYPVQDGGNEVIVEVNKLYEELDDWLYNINRYQKYYNEITGETDDKDFINWENLEITSSPVVDEWQENADTILMTVFMSLQYYKEG